MLTGSDKARNVRHILELMDNGLELPTPEQRVRIGKTPSDKWLWLCACGENSTLFADSQSAYRDWEWHRGVTSKARPA